MTNKNSKIVFCLNSRLISLKRRLWIGCKMLPIVAIFEFCNVILIFAF